MFFCSDAAMMRETKQKETKFYFCWFRIYSLNILHFPCIISLFTKSQINTLSIQYIILSPTCFG